MHRGSVRHINAGWQPASHGDPADRGRLRTAAGGGLREFRSKAALDESPQRLAELRGPLELELLRQGQHLAAQFHDGPLDIPWGDDLLVGEAVAIDLGVVVVHGHTPGRTPVVRPNRIGIDTGAVYGGELTCVVLETDKLAFLTA